MKPQTGADGATQVSPDVGSTEDSNTGAVRNSPVKTPPAPAPMTVILAQALDVLDKQYRLYSWNDSKALSVITADALLFAAVGFLLSPCLPDTLALLLLGLGTILLASSLLIVLRQVVPQGSSGKSGGRQNIRSLRGISMFRTWEGYRDEFFSLSEKQFAEDAVRQIFGMAHNNDDSRKKIDAAIGITSIAILAVILAGVSAAFSAKGYHLLGTWAVASTSQPGVPSLSVPEPRLPATPAPRREAPATK